MKIVGTIKNAVQSKSGRGIGVGRVSAMERLTKPFCSKDGCFNCSEYSVSITKDGSIMLCDEHMAELKSALMAQPMAIVAEVRRPNAQAAVF